MSAEREVRLVGSRDALESVLRKLPELVASAGPVLTRELRSIYYDTPDSRLDDEHLAFRVRELPDRVVQSLKSGNPEFAELFTRGEWECELPDLKPRRKRLNKKARKLLRGAAPKKNLCAVFETRVQRRTCEISRISANGQTASIEVSLDIGEIQIASERIALAELELELLSGTTHVLLDFAIEIVNTEPLWLMPQSKSDRAYDRLRSRTPSNRQANAIRFPVNSSTDQAFTAILNNCVDQWLANHACVIDGRDPEGVHQMRVSLRRFRSALSVFKPILVTQDCQWLRSGLANVLTNLGEKRDWDVFGTDTLAPVLTALSDDAGLRLLQMRQAERKNMVHENLRKMLCATDYTAFILSVALWVQLALWRENRNDKRSRRGAIAVQKISPRLLKQYHRRVLERGNEIGRQSAEERHRLRIAVKKLRYAIEFLRPLYRRKDVKPYHAALVRLQDQLGYLNDVAQAERLASDLAKTGANSQVDRAAGIVIGWHTHRVSDFADPLQQAWADFVNQQLFWQ